MKNNFLQVNLLHHVDILQCLKRKTAQILYQGEKSLLIYDQVALVYMMTAENEEEAKEMIALIPDEAQLVVGHEAFYKPLLIQKLKPTCELICYNAVYEKAVVQQPIIEGLSIKPLTKDYLETVIKNYSSLNTVSIAYLESRIEKQMLYGAFLNEKLSGFGGYHEEGSIGLIEVLPEDQGKGLAKALINFLIEKVLSQGLYAYSQIKINNEVSLALHKKLGFEIAKEEIYWLQK